MISSPSASNRCVTACRPANGNQAREHNTTTWLSIYCIANDAKALHFRSRIAQVSVPLTGVFGLDTSGNEEGDGCAEDGASTGNRAANESKTLGVLSVFDGEDSPAGSSNRYSTDWCYGRYRAGCAPDRQTYCVSVDVLSTTMKKVGNLSMVGAWQLNEAGSSS